MDEFRTFSSYNGLDRVALMMGVPLPVFALLVAASVFISFAGQYFFGIIGFAFLLLLLPVFLFLRQLTATDDQAMRILGIELQFFFKRRGYKEFNNTLTFLSGKYLKNEQATEASLQPYFSKRIFSE